MSKHTHGPWRVQKNNVSFPFIETDDEYQLKVAQCLSSLDQQADAHLIAAAPEMLSWLEAVVNQIDYQFKNNSIVSDDWSGIVGMVPNLKNIIRKAKGE